jgi:hypothetical protein
MEHATVLFSVLAIFAISTSMYFLGGTITGSVTRSMFCDDSGNCHDFCRYDSECTTEGFNCCENGEFGICIEEELCEKRFDFAASNFKLSDKITLSRKSEMGFYSLILGIAITLAIIYFIVTGKQHRKYQKKPKQAAKK